MKQCVIIGAGTYGQTYFEYLKDKYEIIGFIDDNPNLMQSRVNHIGVLGNTEYLFSTIDRSVAVFVPIGNNEIRVNLLTRLSQSGFETPSFVHNSAIIPDSVTIGKAVYILPASNIMPNTKLGDFVMISIGVNIAHHAEIGKGCFLAHGSNIGASVHLAEKVFVGIAATIMSGVKSIGKSALLGAGTVVITDVDDNAVVAGNPGKVIRYNNQT